MKRRLSGPPAGAAALFGYVLLITALRLIEGPAFSWGTLSMTHDEVLMLIISGAVIVEVISTFSYLRTIPHLSLLLGSFASIVLASAFTVAEGFVWPDQLNVLEHLSVMAGAVLLALWSALVFGSRKPEGP